MSFFRSPSRRPDLVPRLGQLQEIAAERVKAADPPTPAPAAVVKAAPPGSAPALDAADLAHAAKARLRAAQDAAAAAAWAGERAAEAAARALAAVAEARRGVLAYADLDSRVADHQAGLLRAGSAVRVPLPAELADARRAKFEAEVELADADAAHELLERESREAAAAVVAAGAVLAVAVDAILQLRCLELVSEMRSTEARAGVLRGLVAGLSASRSSTQPALAWGIQQISYDPQHPHLVDAAGPAWRQATAAWSGFRDRLMADASATFEG